MSGRHYIYMLALLSLPGCGPGISTDPAPVITVESPQEGADTQTLRQTYEGTCRDGLPIALGYGSNVSGPSTTSCSGGRFSFTVQFAAISGTDTVSLAQITDRGTIGIATRNVFFARVALAVANGFTAPYLAPGTSSPLSSNGIADSQLHGAINAMAVDATGNGFVAGAFTAYQGTSSGRVQRLDTGTALGTAFNAGGTGFDNTVNAVLAAPDVATDYYFGGQFASYNGTAEVALARVSGTNGTLTGTFTNSGFTGTVDGGLALGINAIAASDDSTNDIYVGGNFQKYGATAYNGIVRLTSTGVDSTGQAATFNGNIGAGFGGGAVYALAVAGDGTHDLLVGGNFTTYQGNPAAKLIRLGQDGNPAASYSAGTFDGAVYAILPVPGTTEFLVAGAFTHYGVTAANHVIRLKANGTVSLGALNNNLATAFNDSVYTLVKADSNGGVLAGGAFTTYLGTASAGLARFDATSGAIDSFFTIGTGFTGGTVHAITVNAFGQAWVAGSFSSYQGTGVNGLVLLASTGSILSESPAGTGFDGPVQAIAATVDGSGDVYVGGSFTHYNGTAVNQLVRLSMAGELVTSFSSGTGFNGVVDALVMAPDVTGDVYVGGTFITYRGSPAGRIVRLQSDGSLAAGFSPGSGFNGDVYSLIAAPDATGDIYAGGNFTAYNGTTLHHLARVQSTGLRNAGFSIASGASAAIRAMVATNDDTGDFYIGGDFITYNGSPYQRVARVHADGTDANTFDTSAGCNASVRALSLAPDGTLIAGGDFTAFGVTVPAPSHLILIRSDGSPASSYLTTCGLPTGACQLDGTVRALSVDADSHIFAGGDFTHTSSGTTAANHLIAINLDGTQYPPFTASPGADGSVYAITPAQDGSADLYLGGLFRVIQSTLTDPLARVAKTATTD